MLECLSLRNQPVSSIGDKIGILAMNESVTGSTDICCGVVHGVSTVLLLPLSAITVIRASGIHCNVICGYVFGAGVRGRRSTVGGILMAEGRTGCCGAEVRQTVPLWAKSMVVQLMTCGSYSDTSAPVDVPEGLEIPQCSHVLYYV